MAMEVGLNPSRDVATSPSDTICVSCRSHNVSSTRNVDVNVTSDTSMTKTTFVSSQLDNFEK